MVSLLGASQGIVPTDSPTLELETPEALAERLCNYWQVVVDNSGVSMAEVAAQSVVAPARCCLKNIGDVGAHDEGRKKRNREL